MIDSKTKRCDIIMVYVYAADIRNLKDPKKSPEQLKNLSLEDKSMILDSRFVQKRIQYLGLCLLLKSVASRHHLPDTVRLSELYNNPHFDNLHISFSASHNMIICAVGDMEIGCDIEKLREAPQKLSSAYFTKLEKNYLKSFQDEFFNAEYFRLYTMKESYMKMSGTLYPHPAKELEIIFGEEIEIYRNSYIEACYLEEYYIPGYQLSVCSKDYHFLPEITFINLF